MARVNPGVEAGINPWFNPRADDRKARPVDHVRMTTTDYIINALFVFVVFRQARDRQLDGRYFVVPLLVVFWVATQYVHSLPTAGNDLVLVGLLATVGLTLGTVSGFATHLRLNDDGTAVARVGWLAGILLIAGISSRMVFAFAVTHGLEPAVRSFSIAHQIGAAAWPAALVSMGLCEVAARLLTVQLRSRQLTATAAPAAIGSAA